MKILLRVLAVINIVIGSLAILASFDEYQGQLITFVAGAYWLAVGIVMYQASRVLRLRKSKHEK